MGPYVGHQLGARLIDALAVRNGALYDAFFVFDGENPPLKGNGVGNRVVFVLVTPEEPLVGEGGLAEIAE
jgi:hypothetical protein